LRCWLFAALAMAGVAIVIWLNVRGEAPIDDGRGRASGFA
jgi:hypothetical protein